MIYIQYDIKDKLIFQKISKYNETQKSRNITKLFNFALLFFQMQKNNLLKNIRNETSQKPTLVTHS